MAILLKQHPATSGPGIEPRWSRRAEDGVGSDCSAPSRVWFTVSRGNLNEVSDPTIDRPQVRDLQFLGTDGRTFFHDSLCHIESTHDSLSRHAIGFQIVSAARQLSSAGWRNHD